MKFIHGGISVQRRSRGVLGFSDSAHATIRRSTASSEDQKDAEFIL